MDFENPFVEKPEKFLCVFVHITLAVGFKENYELARAAHATWAKNTTDVDVFFLLPPGSPNPRNADDMRKGHLKTLGIDAERDAFPPTITWEEDLDTDYARLPLRTLLMFEVLGRKKEYFNRCLMEHSDSIWSLLQHHSFRASGHLSQ